MIDKKPGNTLSIMELAEALYEGSGHLYNLAESLARQHGAAEALPFFGMTSDDVRAFWCDIARQLIEHSQKWQRGPELDLGEQARLKASFTENTIWRDRMKTLDEMVGG